MRKEPHFTAEKLLSVLGVKAGSLAPLALVPGPKDRSDKILGCLQDSKKVFSFLDYEMHTGRRNGKSVTVSNGGRYAADSAMTAEMLCAAGVESLVRVGTCGSLQKKIKIGDIIIVTGAIRGEGTTPYYVPKDFSTVAHPDIVRALSEAAKKLKVRYHLGWVYTTDALFRETPELIHELEERAVAGIDMVTSAFLTIAQVRQKKAGAILAVSDECLNGSIGFRHPRFLKSEEVMVDVVLKAVDLL